MGRPKSRRPRPKISKSPNLLINITYRNRMVKSIINLLFIIR